MTGIWFNYTTPTPHQEAGYVSWLNKLGHVKWEEDKVDYVEEGHVFKYDKCIKTIKQIIASQARRREFLPDNTMSVYTKTSNVLEHLRLYEAEPGHCTRTTWVYEDVARSYKVLTKKVLIDLTPYEKKFSNIKYKNVE